MFAHALISLVALATQVWAIPTSGLGLVARQGFTENCTTTYTVQSGDNCKAIRDLHGDVYTLAEFYSWNPQVNSFCNDLFAGEIVCVGINNSTGPAPACPVPVKPGLDSRCDNCYTIVSGDECYAIAGANNITVDQFVAWNPHIDAACTNLEVNWNYCIGVAT